MTDKTLYCSFCNKSQHEVQKLLAGPAVFICNECVNLCNDIIEKEKQEKKIRQELYNRGYLIVHQDLLRPDLVKQIRGEESAFDRFNRGAWHIGDLNV